MKTMLLLRHAKSDWSTEHAEDHDRPLNARGRKSASLIGELLARLEQVPDRVLTSSAVRAQETVRLAAKAGSWSCPVEVVPEFYGSGPATVLERLRSEGDDASSLLLVGHEPTWSGVVAGLIGGGAVRFPTAAIARIDAEVTTWRAIEPASGALVWLLVPRLVQALR